MKRTEENVKIVSEFIEDYNVLPGAHRDPTSASKLAKLQMDAYFDACKDIESAKAVHKAVMRNEPRCPAPATIRKWLRELNHVELDVDKNAGV